MLRRLRFSLASALLASLFPVAMNAQVSAQDGVTLNFSNADIEAVVKALSDYTGRTFVIDPRVRGTVNIVSARPVPRGAVYPALLSALRMAGFAAVETGGITKILPEIEARTYAVPAAGAQTGTLLTTRVFTLQNESAAQVLNVVRPLVAPNNSVVAYAPGNALIVTDYADNLRRIEQLIALLDRVERGSAGEPVVITVKHANASDIAQLLRNVLVDTPVAGATAGAEARDRVSVVADPRLNTIVLRADNPSRLARAQALVAQLDQPPTENASNGGLGNVHIVRLRNADATELALTLRKVLGADNGATGSSSPTSAPSLVTTGSTAPNLSALLSGNSSLPAAQNQGISSNNFSNSGTNGSAISFTANGATIFADAANNTLIINAPEAIARNLRAVIDQLDVRRAQVFIEALIVELSAEKAAEFGLQWQALSGLNNGDFRYVGGTNVANPAAIGATVANVLTLPSTIAQSNTNSRGLAIGALREVNIPGIGPVLSLTALAKALEKDAKANVLSNPQLLTLDNQEARFSAGQNLPFVTGQYATTAGQTTPTPFQTIERRDVGLTLRVKPQITEGGTVRLAVYQEVSNVVDFSSTTGVITNKRLIETNVLVEDGQVVALGGLTQDSFTDGEDKVPMLGDVPVLGNLFKYDTRKRSKVSLMVFLRPMILRTATQTNTLGNDRYQQLLGDQLRYAPQPTWFWPDASAPQLPPQGQQQLPQQLVPQPIAPTTPAAPKP